MAAGLLWAACAPPTPPAAVRPPAPRNLLLIVSDSLRADVLGCYGGPARTPAICSLAERGVLFERAYANAPWTLPSSVSMFTGDYPYGYRRVEQRRDGRILPFYFVEASEQLVGETLEQGGWKLRAVIENTVANRAQSMQGFTKTDGQVDAPAVIERLAALGIPVASSERQTLWLAEALLDARPDERHFWLHWIDDPHAPYRPPPLGDDEAAGLPHPAAWYRNLAHSNTAGRVNLREVASSLTPAEVEHIARLYRGEVEDVDRRVAWLLAALERSGRADDTLVIFTSDHGEEFADHGGFLHDHSLYDELVRVPLLVAGPGVAAGRRVAAPVTHVDLMPTLAELLGVVGLGPFDGENILPSLAGGDEPSARRFIYLSSTITHDRDAVVFGRYKLIADTASDAVQLFDLEKDPGERHDVSAELPQVVERLRKALHAERRRLDRIWEARKQGEDPAAIEQALEETEKSLRAVGYIQ